MKTQIQITRDYEMPRTELFRFVVDPANLKRYYNNIEDVTVVAPDDRFRLNYRILGRTVAADVQFIDVQPDRHIRFHMAADPELRATYDWALSDCPVGTRMIVVLEADESSDWFGAAIDRLVVPRALERDLARSLDNLSDLVRLQLSHMKGQL